MKRALVLLLACTLLISCTSVPKETQVVKNEVIPEREVITEYVVSSEIFDSLQRPLGYYLTNESRPITRLNWEYHMAGIGWWDIYLMTGRKLGNGLYECSFENKANCQIVELHMTRTEYDKAVLSVEEVFVSSDKSNLEKIKNDFENSATNFFGKQPSRDSGGITNWDAGWIHYSSHPIQYHESGKWVYVVSSFDSANSPY